MSLDRASQGASSARGARSPLSRAAGASLLLFAEARLTEHGVGGEKKIPLKAWAATPRQQQAHAGHRSAASDAPPRAQRAPADRPGTPITETALVGEHVDRKFAHRPLSTLRVAGAAALGAADIKPRQGVQIPGAWGAAATAKPCETRACLRRPVCRGAAFEGPMMLTESDV